MKKFLALVLALVMTMSLVTVGASAATDFSDDAKITNEEAVEVLNAMGVLTGYADGSFRPEGVLTRGAGAKIIAYLMLGQEAADNLKATYTVFEDVTDTVGLAAYIEWAAKNGIVDGYGDGNFGPYNKLTEYAFGKMLLTALGYDSAKEGYTGAGWQKAVYRDAVAADIYDGSETWGACTRDTAARMAFAALLANVVDYGYNVNGWTDKYEDWDYVDIDVTTGRVYGPWLYLLYGDLDVEDGNDVWGRPGHTWSYGSWSKFFMDAPVAEYTTKVNKCDLLVKLGVPVSSNKSLFIESAWQNGVAYVFANEDEEVRGFEIEHDSEKTPCKAPFAGAQGVLTQVFKVGGEYRVTEIATYLARVTDVAKDHKGYDTDFEVYYRELEDRVNLRDEEDFTAYTTEENWPATAINAQETEKYAVGEYVLVQVVATENGLVLVNVAETDATAGKLTKAYGEEQKDPSVTYVDKVAKKDAFAFVNCYGFSKDAAMLGVEFDFFYDSYGNVIGMVERAGAATKYLVIDAIDSEIGRKVSVAADVVTVGAKNDKVSENNNVVKYLTHVVAEWESDVAESYIGDSVVDNADLYNHLTIYTVDEKGNYTIVDDYSDGYVEDVVYFDDAVHTTAQVSKNYMIAGEEAVEMDSKTQVLLHTASGYKAYVGVKSLPAFSGDAMEVVYGADGVADIVYVVNAVTAGDVLTGLVINPEPIAIELINGVAYNEYTLYVEGKATPVYVAVADDDYNLAGGMYTVTFKAVDGVVVASAIVEAAAKATALTYIEAIVEGEEETTFVFSDWNTITWEDSIKVFLVDANADLTNIEVTAGTVADLAEGDDVIAVYSVATGAILEIYRVVTAG